MINKAGFSQYYVCHYGPGIEVGQPVYQTGEPATECIEGTVPSLDKIGLCESAENVNVLYNKQPLSLSPSDC